MIPFYECNISDLEELYDFIKKEKISDISEILYYILDNKSTSELKFGWLAILENEKLLDLICAYIQKINNDYDNNIVKSYYDIIKQSMVSI